MSQNNITPNFFIVGAPRCGTTAMGNYLSDHRDICFSLPKEPHYFSTDMPAMQFAETESDYLKCYGHCLNNEYLAIGEGSVWYLYSEVAIANILRYRPKAKFIIMVRNPLDMVPSFHQKAFESFDEDVVDFAEAWRLQKSRLEGLNIPKKCRDSKLLQYSKVGKLGAQVVRAFDQIPEPQRLVIVFDDLVDDVVEVYKVVLEFLSVPYDGRLTFPRINENKRVRSRFLLALAWNPPAKLMRIVERTKRLLNIKELSVLPRLRDKLVVSEDRLALSDEMRERMVEEFSSDIDLLAISLERDLSHWKKNHFENA